MRNGIEWRTVERFLCQGEQGVIDVRIMKMTAQTPGSERLDGLFRICAITGEGCHVFDMAGLSGERCREEAFRFLIAAQDMGYEVEEVDLLRCIGNNQ